MRNATRGSAAFLRLALGAISLLAAGARGATPSQVDTAMKKAVAALYSQENNGNWEIRQTRGPEEENFKANGQQWTGLTAITAYALLCSGESKTDSRISSAIDFLVANPSEGVYASSARCLLWSRVELTPARHAAAQKDVEYLLKAMRTKGDAKGLYFYTIPAGSEQTKYDNSASQMAVLGLSVMTPLGFEVPREFWRLTEQAWQSHQLSDGSWCYGPIYKTGVSSMTAAGVATLFITQQLLSDRSDCNGGANDPHIDNGLNWLANNFDATFDASRETGKHHLEQYALFAISRVGFASGLRYFGKEDWYQRGADYLIRTQQTNGNWVSDRPASTALGLLFLAYGSSPVVLNKLQYAPASESGKPAVAGWNQRPQDLSNFTEWMGHQLETRLNWQLVNLSSTVEALHDAPVLVIEGSRALNFSDADRAKLRQYVEEGGMIVGNADCDNAAFSKSFLALGQTLFPGYEFRELPPTHPIYTNENYKAAKFKRPAKVAGLSNGVRELMLLPSGDFSRAFQRRNEATQPEFYHLFDDIVLYAMDTSGLTRKGNSYVVQENAAAPIARHIKLARLQYTGNWDPEPGGWRRLAAILHNSQKIAMDIQPVTLGDGKLITPPAQPEASAARPSEKEIRQIAVKRIPPTELTAAMADDPQKAEAMINAKTKEVRAELDAAAATTAAGHANFTLAHLTGTASLKFTEAQRAELKKFVDSGGTLIVDAAGGSTEFAASAEQMLLDTFGPAARQLDSPLNPDAPIYRQAGHALDKVQFRPFARSRLSGANMPQLRGIQINGRLAIIYSREDLSAGLVGEPVDGVTGYTPTSATELMTDICLYVTNNSHPH